MSNVVIRFDHISKTYKLYRNDKMRFLGLFFKRIPHKLNHAVKDLSLEVTKGERIALLGRNGAGKSTMLKMVTGVCYPTEGELTVDGRVSALLELTAGFDPEFTGRENIYLKCNLMGLTDEEVKEVEEDIVEFADIGDYIDQPVRTYSSGMKARLGFGINANIQPEIFIVDEALSVGDKSFRQKCLDKVNSITSNQEVTLLFVTHNTNTAKNFCSRGIVMEKGVMKFDGPIDEAVAYYEENN